MHSKHTKVEKLLYLTGTALFSMMLLVASEKDNS